MTNQTHRDARSWRHINHPLRRAWLRFRAPKPRPLPMVILPEWLDFDSPRIWLARSTLEARYNRAVKWLATESQRHTCNILAPDNSVSVLLRRQAD